MKDNLITIKLFEELNKNSIKYCVLRNYISLPNNTGGSDLDIWIKKSDYKKFLHIINNVCIESKSFLVSYKEDKFCPQITLCSLSSGLQIDVYLGCAYHKGKAYIDEYTIEKNILTYNEIKILSPDVDGMISFLKEILNNKKCNVKNFIKAHRAVEHKTDTEIEDILKLFSKNTQKQIIKIIKSGEFNEKSINRLGKLASKDIHSFYSEIKYLFVQISKIKRFIKPLGYTIAFLGTDGSGKSTIINHITPILGEAFHKGIHYEHMRPNYFPSLSVLTGKSKKNELTGICENPHGGKQSGLLGSLLRITYYWIDYTIGYLMKVYPDKSIKNHIWIFDRYFYDYMNDQKRVCIKLPKSVLKIYNFFVPSPDIIVCLYADPNIIYNRKPELPLKEVNRQIEDLKSFASKNKKAILIDTGKSIKESVDNTMDEIIKIMNKRFNNIDII